MPSQESAASRLLELGKHLGELAGRSSSGVSRELQGLARELSELAEGLRSGTPAERSRGRLASVATRIATHFFVEKSLPRFCECVLDELIEETGAGSGTVVLFDRETALARVIAARDARKQSVPFDKVRVSRTILSRMRDGEESVLVHDALSDELLQRQDSIRNLRLRSVAAIPLRFQTYLAGAVYLENESASGAFSGEELAVLQAVGRLVAIYLNASFRLEEEIAARERIYDEIKGKTHFDGIVGSSRALMEVLSTVTQVGTSDATVLIEGENGTGKELVARAVHRTSHRAAKPFVVVNCAAIPENLLESELFGHDRGAFTGAFETKRGHFEKADGGTLFLDEIGEMSSLLQAKLLRFLQNGELQRVGGTKSIHVDARLVTATNRDLKALVAEGKFREDLFFRLYVVPIRVPPLRERVEDIPLLAEHFVKVFALQSGREPLRLEPEVHEALQRYSWPGNVRELENLMQRLVVLARGDRVRLEDLPEHVHAGARATLDTGDTGKDPFGRFLATTPTSYEELKRRRDEIYRIAAERAQTLEDRFLDAILERAGGNISRAAEQAGINRTVIHRKLKSREPSGGYG